MWPCIKFTCSSQSLPVAPLSRAGLTPDQHHPKYILTMLLGPVGLLHLLCSEGGPHPCLDRLLKHQRCPDILERLLSFIARVPNLLSDTECTTSGSCMDACTSDRSSDGGRLHYKAMRIAKEVLSHKGDPSSVTLDVRPIAGAPLPVPISITD